MNWKNLLLTAGSLICIMGVVFGASKALESLGEQKLAEQEQEIMELLLPNSETFTEEVYEGDDANITGVFKGENGYVIETTVAGYADDMRIWVGVDNEGTVTGITVRDLAETVGLGHSAATDATFLLQYVDSKGDLTVGENVDALSGATVTSKAVTRAVNSASAFVTGADTESSATEWGG